MITRTNRLLKQSKPTKPNKQTPPPPPTTTRTTLKTTKQITRIMKVLIVLSAFVVAASASRLAYGPAPIAAVATGSSSQFRSEDNYGNYNFGYDESHPSGGSSRREEETNGVRRGSYSLSDADGRRRVVNYIADADGFRATIETNEPGVEPKDPADTLINKAAPVAVAVAAPLPAPVLAAPAPIPVPVPVAAPVKGYFSHRPVGPIAAPLPAPVLAAPAPVYSAPAPVYGPAPAVVEAPTPRAFSYSFGSTHLAAAPVYAAPAPIAPAPVYQQRLEY